MILEGRPEIKDEFAKTKFKAHSTFGGKVVEILYGARDAEGRSIMPKEDGNDGHGRWFGIETDGTYQMFSWRHSAEEGGAVEYGTAFGDDALSVMETQLNRKKELCREAEEIGKSGESDEGESRLAAIRAELNGMENWHTPKDAEYEMRLAKAEKAYGGRHEIYSANRAVKQAILDQAEALRSEENFNKIRQELRRLRGELSETESAGTHTDDDFWQKFRDIENELKKREETYFANLDQHRGDAKAAKEQIIAEVKKLTANVSNWKEAGEKLNDAFARWKAAGSAGHDTDEALWAEFEALRKDFYAGRQDFFKDRNEKWQASIEAKEALIKEADAIAGEKIFDRAHTDRMKELDIAWKKAGFSGKENNDRLWDEFNKAKDIFWGGKREAAMKRINEQIEARTAELEAARKQLADLEYRKTLDATPALQEGIERNIYMKKTAIAEMEAAIDDLKKRME